MPRSSDDLFKRGLPTALMKDHPRQTSRRNLDGYGFPAAIFSDPHALNVVFEDGWRWENGQLNGIHTTLLVMYHLSCEGFSYNLLRRSCLTVWYGQGLFLAATYTVCHFCCAVLWVDVFHTMLLLFVLTGLSACKQLIHTLLFLVCQVGYVGSRGSEWLSHRGQVYQTQMMYPY